jgi:signal transduction histidine kinase
MMMFFDNDGELLWGALMHPDMETYLPLVDQLLRPITIDHPLLNRPNKMEGASGLLQAKTAPLLVAASPILTSVAEGPPVGTLVIGRFLSADRTESLAKRTSVDFKVYDPNSPADAQMFTEFYASSSENNGGEVWEIDEGHITSFGIQNDVFGEAALLLEVNTSRRITDIGSAAIKAASIFLLVISALFLLAAWIMMRQMIVAPVSKLTHHMLKIRKTGNLDQSFGSNRQDEIGLLANEFDQLATQLGIAQSELEAARDDAVAVSKAKSEFLARMSHEIRTPMNGVLGMIELLNNTPLASTQKRYAQTIHESADSLLEIINDVLDFSKIESGKLQLETICFDLNSFLSDLLASLEGLAYQKGLNIELEVPDGPGLAVYGDPFRLRQVMTNLIGNAIKFTEKGSITICITAEDVDATRKDIEFAVKDTGTGISEDKQRLIFESFAQEDGSTTRRFGGTGLGLAISKQLIELMNGDLPSRSQRVLFNKEYSMQRFGSRKLVCYPVEYCSRKTTPLTRK